jgi:hypothetical protein
MGNYVLTFRVPKGRVPTVEEEARWPQWFEKITAHPNARHQLRHLPRRRPGRPAADARPAGRGRHLDRLYPRARMQGQWRSFGALRPGCAS